MPLRRYPAEVTEQVDPQTGRRILQLTRHPSIHHHLYFLTSSLTPDEQWLIFCSYRSGSPQLYRTCFPCGEIQQLTEEEELHGFSGVISADGSQLYYTAGGRIRAVELDTGAATTVADIGRAQLGECSLSADGRWIVTAARLPEGGFGLAVAATDGSYAEVVHRVDRTIIHPQFHPRDSGRILYARDPAPRMWMVGRDGAGDTCLYAHGNDEFLVHETFLGDTGEELIVVRWPYTLLRFHLETHTFREIVRLNAWHIASSRDGRRVLCDTVHPDRGLLVIDVGTGAWETLCYPGSSCGGSQWKQDRYALAEDFAAARQAAEREQSLSWMEMKADTVYGPQWTHPHPSFSPSERGVVYTSDCSGHPQVYVVEVGNG
jgi:oligogalacturonide lyase